jgi:hypothetical protein
MAVIIPADRHPLASPRHARLLFDQSKWWVPAANEKLRIKEMEPGHLVATMVMLLEGAHKYFITYQLGDREILDNDRTLREHFVRTDVEARDWVVSTILFKALFDRWMEIR